ncbi:ankyrin repeat domain-containing protein [Thermodesulfobacteriota bacterium]
MPTKKHRTRFWVVSTYVLTALIPIPFLAFLAWRIFEEKVFALLSRLIVVTPTVQFGLYMGLMGLASIAGMYYALSSLRRTVIISDPIECVRPAIAAFIAIIPLRFAWNGFFWILLPSLPDRPGVPLVLGSVLLCAYYCVISIVFIKITRTGIPLLPQQRAWETSPVEALKSAALRGDVEVLKRYLDEGGSVGFLTKPIKGYPNLLIRAATANQAEIVRLFLDRGADVNARDWKGRTVLDHAKEEGRKDVVELLKSYGAKR